MKSSQLFNQRIRRVRVLFKELGFTLFSEQKLDDAFISEFENEKGVQGSLYIDERSKFFEIGFTFSFSSMMTEFLKTRMEEILHACYDYGCYVNINKKGKELSFSIFTKLYYAGLNYDALKYSLVDYSMCVKDIMKIVELDINNRHKS